MPYMILNEETYVDYLGKTKDLYSYELGDLSGRPNIQDPMIFESFEDAWEYIETYLDEDFDYQATFVCGEDQIETLQTSL
jgi:hypothetical protein